MKTFDRHIFEIQAGGWRVLRLKIHVLIRYLVLLIHAFWAVPAVLFIRAIRRWRIIRMGPITSSRIGCFALEAGQKWAMSQRQSGTYLDLYWFDKPICNEFLAVMMRRNFFIHPLIRPLDFWNQKIPGGTIHHLPTEFTFSCRDIHGWLEQTRSPMSFLPEEDARAVSWLSRQGWKKGEPYVCLLVRDSSYLDSTYPNMTPPAGESAQFHPQCGYGWNHLNNRDSDIATYVPAAEWLADQGVWVIRMGKVMARPIPSRHPRIIDYAFHKDRDDFLDIWLFAHCDLCITTVTGPDVISDNYRRPLLLLNYTPLRWLWSWSNAMHLPKTLVWQTTGIPLTLREQLDCHAAYYDQFGIRVIDLTPEEILSAVIERWQRLKGTWTDTEDDLRRHRRFWDILRTSSDYAIEHDWIHPEARVGTCWLRSKGDDFLDEGNN